MEILYNISLSDLLRNIFNDCDHSDSELLIDKTTNLKNILDLICHEQCVCLKELFY